jgi:hypothetical protein
LAEFGTTSELKEWGETRRLGRRRYVMGMTLRFGFVTVISCAIQAYRGETSPVLYALNGGWWVLFGFVFGWWSWRGSEKQYAESLSTGTTAEATGVQSGSTQQV